MPGGEGLQLIDLLGVGVHSWFPRTGLTGESTWDLSHSSCLKDAKVGMGWRNGDTGKGMYVPRTQ